MKEIHTLAEFESINKEPLIVVLAKTHGCNVCTALSSQLDVLMRDFPNIPLYHVYLDGVAEFRGQYLVLSAPTLLVFSKGKEIYRESRFIRLSNFERLLKNYIE